MKRLLNNNINTIAHWDTVYKQVEFLSSDLFRYQFIASQLLAESKIDVLDLGCGKGKGCEVIAQIRPFARITGIDFAQKTIEEASMNYPECNFMQSDVSNISLPDASFDYVIASETLEHLDTPQALVDEMLRLTRTYAILTTPIGDHVPSGEHVWEFTYKDIKKLFNKFTQVHILPWASQRKVFYANGATKYEGGDYDTFYVLAIK